jgi:hypothetical protein
MPAVRLSTHWSIAVAEHRLWYRRFAELLARIAPRGFVLLENDARTFLGHLVDSPRGLETSTRIE